MNFILPVNQSNTGTNNFWLEDWRSLFNTYTLLPTYEMSEAERLNAITRLIIVIAIILAIMRVGSWILFLILGIILIIILWYIQKPKIEHLKCERIIKNYNYDYNLKNKEKRKINILPKNK